MHYLSILLMVLGGALGFYIGIAGYRKYIHITRTAERVAILQILGVAVRFGIAGSLIFFTTISFVSARSPEYIWSFQSLVRAFLVSFIPGIIITLGTVYQVYTTVIFRDMLIRKYKERDESESRDK